jgi:predicted RecA/RadA family phage recombinase
MLRLFGEAGFLADFVEVVAVKHVETAALLQRSDQNGLGLTTETIDAVGENATHIARAVVELPDRDCTALPTGGRCALATGATGSERDDSVAQPPSAAIAAAARTTPQVFDTSVDSPWCWNGSISQRARGAHERKRQENGEQRDVTLRGGGALAQDARRPSRAYVDTANVEGAVRRRTRGYSIGVASFSLPARERGRRSSPVLIGVACFLNLYSSFHTDLSAGLPEILGKLRFNARRILSTRFSVSLGAIERVVSVSSMIQEAAVPLLDADNVGNPPHC